MNKEVQTDHSSKVFVSRDVFTQSDIDALHEKATAMQGTEKERKCPKIDCTRARVSHILFYFIPIVTVLKNYCHDFRNKFLGK